MPLLIDAAERLGIDLQAKDPHMSYLAHQTMRLLVEISGERARREAGDYGSASVIDEMSGAESPPYVAGTTGEGARFACLNGAFGSPAAEMTSTADAGTVMALINTTVRAGDMAAASSDTAHCTGTSLTLSATSDPEAVKRPLPQLRIDIDIFDDGMKEHLRDPLNMTVSEAFDMYVAVKRAGYGDEFQKTQKRIPEAGNNFERNTFPSLKVARKFWVDVLEDCRLHEVTNKKLETALELLWRLPKHHGRQFLNVSGFHDLVNQVDNLEIEQQAAAERAIELDPTLSEAQAEQMRLDAKIPRLRTETYLKHGRQMGRIGRFLEGLGLVSANPFALCAWTKNEEADMKANEELRTRQEWDDRIYELFRTPEFQGHAEEPGSPLFWAPLIAVHNGLRMQEVLQLRPSDFGTEGGIAYMQVRNSDGNNVKSLSSERRLPVHPNLVSLGLMDLADLRRRENEPRLFPNLGRGETKGTFSELFTKRFGYYRKTNDVYWPGLDFHAFRTTFHGFLLNSHTVQDARRRRLMGHTDVDEGISSYDQALKASTLLDDVKQVDIDVSMIVSPFRPSADKVVSLAGIRHRQAV